MISQMAVGCNCISISPSRTHVPTQPFLTLMLLEYAKLIRRNAFMTIETHVESSKNVCAVRSTSALEVTTKPLQYTARST
jgi:hypothetical protein